MRVAVTGGTGFIGMRVVRQLRGAGHDVVCVVRSPEKASALSEMGATLKKGDILDRASLDAAFAGADAVMHIAASYELGVVGKRADAALAQNLEGTRNALEAGRDAGAKKIVYTSSIVVHGTTKGEVVEESFRTDGKFFSSFYGMSKHRAHYEVAVPLMQAGVPVVIVQPGAVLGPRDHSTVRMIFRLLARGLPLTLGGAMFGMVCVDECARGHVLALEKGRPGECYHLVTENLRLPELAARAAATAGIKDTTVVIPDAVLHLNRWFMMLAERVLPVPDFLSSDALRNVCGDVFIAVKNDKARAELGWNPRPLEEVCREILTDELTQLGKPLPPQLAT